MPEFSIIIPVYNVENYLDECVDSVIRQLYTNFEIVLVDDGSTDKSGDICDAWTLKDSRVHVVHRSNGGLSAARNTGIDAAKGKYLLFLDSDDYWVSDTFLEQVSERIVLTGPDVLIANYCKVTDGIMSKPYFEKQQNMPLQLEKEKSLKYVTENGLWVATACNKIIRSRLFENGKLRFVEGIISEDVDWCLRLALQADQFDYCNLMMFAYRQRGNSLSHAMTLRKIQHQFDNIERCLSLIKDANEEKQKLLQPYIAYQSGMLYFNIALLPQKNDRKSACAQAKAFAPLLKGTADKRLLFVYYTIKILGIRCTVGLLRLVSCLLLSQ